MSDPTIRRFRALVEERFRFLEARGFRRARQDEDESPVGASVAYAGHHVGFRITYDVRDSQVDVRVVRARDGRLAETGEGGYSHDLLGYLVERAGFRGGMPRSAPVTSGASPLQGMVDSWAELLRTEGGTLLADSADALPGE